MNDNNNKILTAKSFYSTDSSPCNYSMSQMLKRKQWIKEIKINAATEFHSRQKRQKINRSVKYIVMSGMEKEKTEKWDVKTIKELNTWNSNAEILKQRISQNVCINWNSLEPITLGGYNSLCFSLWVAKGKLVSKLNRQVEYYWRLLQ